jgi:hypothetical protein
MHSVYRLPPIGNVIICVLISLHILAYIHYIYVMYVYRHIISRIENLAYTTLS